MSAPMHIGRSRLSEPDEISHLGLDEVQARLARLDRLLASKFGTSPTSPRGVSPLAAAAGASASASASASTALAPDNDPVRSRLLAVRDALRAREGELLATNLSGMNMADSPLATSPRSAKARALEMLARQEGPARGGRTIVLPMNQSIALGTRDFDNQTAAKLANLSMEPLGNGRRHIDDEMGRAAEAAAYARAHVDAGDDDDLFDSDEAYAAATVYSSTRRDAGNGLLMTTARTRREEGFDEDLELDEDEDDDEFAEGNDEYPLAVPQDEE